MLIVQTHIHLFTVRPSIHLILHFMYAQTSFASVKQFVPLVSHRHLRLHLRQRQGSERASELTKLITYVRDANNIFHSGRVEIEHLKRTLD